MAPVHLYYAGATIMEIKSDVNGTERPSKEAQNSPSYYAHSQPFLKALQLFYVQPFCLFTEESTQYFIKIWRKATSKLLF